MLAWSLPSLASSPCGLFARFSFVLLRKTLGRLSTRFNRRTRHCRALCLLNLSPPVRFRLRRSAHCAHALFRCHSVSSAHTALPCPVLVKPLTSSSLSPSAKCTLCTRSLSVPKPRQGFHPCTLTRASPLTLLFPHPYACPITRTALPVSELSMLANTARMAVSTLSPVMPCALPATISTNRSITPLWVCLSLVCISSTSK